MPRAPCVDPHRLGAHFPASSDRGAQDVVAEEGWLEQHMLTACSLQKWQHRRLRWCHSGKSISARVSS